jgi:predicted dehydrogenase
MKKTDIVIIGAGMYACGKGTEGFGTILPAVFEAYRKGQIACIRIAATTRDSARQAAAKAKRLKALFNIDPPVMVYPEQQEKDQQAFLRALKEAQAPACAIVSVPDHLHFDITKCVIENKLHVLVVKPLVPTTAEALELIRLKDAYQIHGAVEYHKRFDEANLKLLEVIQNGDLGNLLHFRINYSQRKIIPSSFFKKWIHHTDIFQYLGVHYVDLIHFLTSARPLRVMSYGSKKWLISKDIDTFDCIQTQIEWQMPETRETFLSSHFTSWVDPDTTSAMSDQRIEVIGTKGRYRSDQKNRGVSFVCDAMSTEEINPYFTQIYSYIDGDSKSVHGYGPRSILQFIQDVEDLSHNKRNLNDLNGHRSMFETSLVSTAVIEASKESLNSKNIWIDIKKLE